MFFFISSSSTTIPRHGPCPQVCLIYPVMPHWWKLVFPLPVGANHRQLLGERCSLRSLSAGTPSGLNLCGFCTSCYSLWKFLCSPVRVRLEDSVSWSHPSPLAPLPLRSLILEGRGLMKLPDLALSAPRSLALCTAVGVSLIFLTLGTCLP